MHRTNRMKQSWSIHFPHQLMCRYQGLGCIPSWLDCIRSGKNYLGGKFVFISWFPALAVCRRIVIHMRDRSTWGRRVMPGMVPGVGAIFSICQGNNHRHKYKRAPLFRDQSHQRQWPAAGQSEGSMGGEQPMRGQQTAQGADLSSLLRGIKTNWLPLPRLLFALFSKCDLTFNVFIWGWSMQDALIVNTATKKPGLRIHSFCGLKINQRRNTNDRVLSSFFSRCPHSQSWMNFPAAFFP